MVTKAKPKNKTSSVRAGKEPAVKQAPVLSMESVDGEIRQRAYQIYAERGSTPGSDMSDWLQAEKEVRTKYGIPA